MYLLLKLSNILNVNFEFQYDIAKLQTEYIRFARTTLMCLYRQYRLFVQACTS